jgi:hypothetical protein
MSVQPRGERKAGTADAAAAAAMRIKQLLEELAASSAEQRTQ